MEGMPILLLTMTGAKTGRTLVRPLCYSRDGDLIVIIASVLAASTRRLLTSLTGWKNADAVCMFSTRRLDAQHPTGSPIA
jgi:F420H(2)-dependent quinone reductase